MANNNVKKTNPNQLSMVKLDERIQILEAENANLREQVAELAKTNLEIMEAIHMLQGDNKRLAATDQAILKALDAFNKALADSAQAHVATTSAVMDLVQTYGKHIMGKAQYEQVMDQLRRGGAPV